MLRGLAVVMMVFYHLAFDLNYFGLRQFDLGEGSWFYFARVTVSLFLLLVGLSLSLSYNRAKRSGEGSLFLKFVRRGLWIFALGMGISLATYLLLDEGFIVFGALHLIGVSIILAYPFLGSHRSNLFFGLLFILIGYQLQLQSFTFPWLLWLGLIPAGFYSLDYLPLFPWFGVVLIGISLGHSLYPDGRRGFYLPDFSRFSWERPLSILGRNSLFVYLIHQPLIIAALYLLGEIGLPFR
jgi:uncharacterized membrane protein